MHTATLLHDDVVDESDLRRGKPAARMVWGNQASVLVGDFLLGQAFKMMVEVGSLEALDILSDAAAIIAEGEVMQLGAAKNTATTEDEYLAVIQAKTAALFSAAAEVGPVLAGRGRAERAAFRSYGTNLGLAFQLDRRRARLRRQRRPNSASASATTSARARSRCRWCSPTGAASDADRAFWKRVLEDGDDRRRRPRTGDRPDAQPPGDRRHGRAGPPFRRGRPRRAGALPRIGRTNRRFSKPSTSASRALVERPSPRLPRLAAAAQNRHAVGRSSAPRSDIDRGPCAFRTASASPLAAAAWRSSPAAPRASAEHDRRPRCRRPADDASSGSYLAGAERRRRAATSTRRSPIYDQRAGGRPGQPGAHASACCSSASPTATSTRRSTLAERLIAVDDGNPVGAAGARGRRRSSRQLRRGQQANLDKIAPAPTRVADRRADQRLGRIRRRARSTRRSATIDATHAARAGTAIFKDYHTRADPRRRRPQRRRGRGDQARLQDRRDGAPRRRRLRAHPGARRQARRGDPGARSHFAGEAPLASGDRRPARRRSRPASRWRRSRRRPRPASAEVLYGLGSAIGTDDGPELPAAYLRLAAYLDPTAYLAIAGARRHLPGRRALRRGDRDLRDGAEDARASGATPTSRSATASTRSTGPTRRRRTSSAWSTPTRRTSRRRSSSATSIAATTASPRRPTPTRAASPRSPTGARPTGASTISAACRYERSKRWPEAEADFQQALKINPDQPQVLNYLGYSWVDRGINLDEALDMIKTAVDLRPNDGYIVDSLGWAYYRLGRYEEAVDGAGDGGRAASRRTRSSTTTSATPTGRSGASARRCSSGRTRATSSRRRTNCRRSSPSSSTVSTDTPALTTPRRRSPVDAGRRR